MSSSEITHRSLTDKDFANAVQSNPSEALDEYDLSPDVIEAIESGDETQIRSALGQDLEAGKPNQGPPERV